MKVNNITVNNRQYAIKEDQVQSNCSRCEPCSFDNDNEGCYLVNGIIDCDEHSCHFIEIKKEDMKSITEEIKAWNPDTVEEQIPGTKYDSGKLQYTLVPPYALQEVARNLTAGLKKYKERNNWQKVPEARQRYMDALMRHFEAIRRGEIIDHESTEPNMSHMSAVAVNAMFLLEFMYNPELQEPK